MQSGPRVTQGHQYKQLWLAHFLLPGIWISHKSQQHNAPVLRDKVPGRLHSLRAPQQPTQKNSVFFLTCKCHLLGKREGRQNKQQKVQASTDPTYPASSFVLRLLLLVASCTKLLSTTNILFALSCTGSASQHGSQHSSDSVRLAFQDISF